MGSTVVGLCLLLWFAGPLDAQFRVDSCRRPVVRNGYFLPEEEYYEPGARIVYTCGKRHKPAADGWWAASLCQDGTWVPKPQCIDEGACLPPEVPNAISSLNATDWYPHGGKIRIKCEEGFEQKNFNPMAVCENGSWSTLPVCTKRSGACGEPPQVLHALVINQGHREVFPEDSLVQYQCKEGYVLTGGSDDPKLIYCISGKWTEPPTCAPSCALDTHPVSNAKLLEVVHLKEGEGMAFSCAPSYDPHTVIVWCKGGQLTLSGCCRDYDRNRGACT